MSHAFSLQVAAAASESRLARLQAAGWRVETLRAGTTLAVTGAAGICRTPGQIAAGLVFLEDRAAVTAQLDLPPDRAAAASDLDLLAALRAAAGPEALRDVTGAFSVVFMDPDSGAVEFWRDRFGLYPACYSEDAGALTCSSDLRACLHLSERAVRPDPVRLADFIHGADIDLDRTAFEGIRRLPPAHRLTWSGGTAQATRYWSPDAGTEVSASPDAAARDLRTALETATANCLRPEIRTGAMLSGGLDSSTLAGLAAACADTPVQTLSFVYGAAQSYDETPFIDAAAERFGVGTHKVSVTQAPQLAALGPLIEEQMDLFLAPGLQKSRRIYSDARALGLDALIDGHGGDEVISHGYGRLAELAHRRAYAALVREARGAARVHGVPVVALVAGHLGQYAGLPRRHPLRRLLLKIARTATRRASLTGWQEKPAALIAPDLRRRIDPDTRYRPDAPMTTPAEFARAERILHLRALTDPIMVQSFEVLHRSATAAGVLPRYPFFDSRVVALCLSLPSEMKLRGGQSRWILREAMRGVLPEMIRTRPDKAEFGAELRQSVTGFYADKDAAVFAPLAEWLDVAAAERLRAAVIAGALDDVAAIRALWRLAVLCHWETARAQWATAQTAGELI